MYDASVLILDLLTLGMLTMCFFRGEGGVYVVLTTSATKCTFFMIRASLYIMEVKNCILRCFLL